MIKSKKYINSPYFWDYKIAKKDLAKPEVKKFWLERKINFSDWRGIAKKDLRKYLPELNIRQDMKNLLTIFLENEDKK